MIDTSANLGEIHGIKGARINYEFTENRFKSIFQLISKRLMLFASRLDERGEKDFLRTFQKEIFSQQLNIPKIPAIALKISSMVSKPDTTVSEFTSVIKSDPNLALKILRINNSALFGASNRSESIEQAVVKLGMEGLKNLVFTYFLQKNFLNSSKYLKNLNTVWRHNFGVAILAQRLAQFSFEDKDRVYLIGLFHDLGMLVFFNLISAPSVDGKNFTISPSSLNSLAEELNNHINLLTLLKWNLDFNLISQVMKVKNGFEAAEFSVKLVFAADKIMNYLDSANKEFSFEKIFSFTEKLGLDISKETTIKIVEGFQASFDKEIGVVLAIR